MQLHATTNSNPVSVVSLSDGGPGEESARDLLMCVGRMMRVTTKLKQQFANAAGNDIEWSGHFLLSVLERGGPMRAADVADEAHLDPSTVSRQIAALCKAGLIERRADPDDGRASQLVITDAGRAIYDAHLARRVERFQQMLGDWTDDECRNLSRSLERLTDAFAERFAAIHAETHTPNNKTQQAGEQ